MSNYRVDFNAKNIDLGRGQELVDVKKDLRKAHFSFGSDFSKDVFQTTNMERFKRSSLTASQEVKIKSANDFKFKGNIVFSPNDKSDYKSQMQASMVKHDINQALSNKEQMLE